MKQSIQIILLLISLNLFGQTVYSGFIETSSVEWVTQIYSDGVAQAVYVYSDYDKPVLIEGNYNQKDLIFTEKDTKGNDKAILIFEDFDLKNNQIEGVWKNLKTKEVLKINLTKDFDIDYGDNVEWVNREIIQRASLKNQYFKVVISKKKGVFYPWVTGVKIFEKETDQLIQQIDLDCDFRGLESISIGDYNFDGLEDFSVFESFYAGPNTSSLYFLFDPTTKQYIDSGFSGTSLEFDSNTKRIYEHNQSRAGNSHVNAEYKIENNRMVLIKRTCVEYDPEKEDFVEVKCEEESITDTWYWKSVDDRNQSVLYLTQTDNSVSGNYCSVFYEGNKIDCTEEEESNFSLTLTQTTQNVFEGTFQSFSHSGSGTLRLTYDPANEKLNLEILSSQGIYYLPQEAIFER